MLSKAYFTFFKELNENNNKAWFDENRATYEKVVKAPFTNLVQLYIEKIQTVDPSIQMQPKDAMFRINKDIRFSKDKSPYKTSMSAIISRYGRKAMGAPGIYFEVGITSCAIGGGVYAPDKDELLLVRDLIMNESATFSKLSTSPVFVKHFGEIQGEKNKVLPAEFKKAAEQQPLLYNKQFFWWKNLPQSVFTTDNTVDVLFEYYMAAKPLSDFFSTVFDS